MLLRNLRIGLVLFRSSHGEQPDPYQMIHAYDNYVLTVNYLGDFPL